MRSGRRLLGTMVLVVAAGGNRVFSAQDPVGALVGQRLVTLAYNRSRATELTPALAAEEAEVLLLAAQRVDPQNIQTAKLLVEASIAANDKAGQRDALRTLVRLDPGDLVAQVQYIDYLASNAQTIDERARTFQGALDSAAFDPQIRSEMAVRLAGIVTERGDTAAAEQFTQQALTLNDVNIGALQARVRLTRGKPTEELKALIALLSANPLLPDAWVEVARLLERAGAFDKAADYLNTALEQYQLAGQPMAADLYLELALDLATAGRPVEAHPIFEALAKLPDAPLSALVAAQILANEYTPKAATTSTAAATQAGGTLESRIRDRLVASIKADPASSAALADAVWVELSAMAKPAADTETWLTSLRTMLRPDDPVLVRLEGWKLLRDGKLESASGILEEAAPADPLAQLGLARVFLSQHRTADGEKELQDLWWTHPTGVFALQVAQVARSAGATGGGAHAGFKLAPAVLTQELTGVLATLPGSLASTHRHLRDMQLVTANFPARAVQLEEAVPLQLRISNTTDRALAVGPDGMIKTTVGLAAKTFGVDRQNLGVYAIEDLQRVYRLEPRASIEATVRVDQGKVAEFLQANPRQTFTMDITLLTSPRGSLKNAAVGLGGQRVPVGDFVRNGRALSSGNDIVGFLEELKKTSGVQQAVDVELLSLAIEMLSDERTRKGSSVDEAPEAAEARTGLRAQITKGMVPVIESPSAVLRAWTALMLPMEGLNELQGKLMAMSADPDPVVRISWMCAMATVVQEGGPGAADAIAALQKQQDRDQDSLVRRGITAMLADFQQTAAAKKAAS